jgi:hypothetical protein
MLAVTTFLWNDSERVRNYTFTHEHVRILKRMVERNLTAPHKFLCVTDQEIDGVNTVHIDMAKHVPNTVYARLMMRRPDFGELIDADRVFNLDLDLVITGNIDSLVCRPEGSVFWKNPNFGQPQRAYYQSSIQLFTPGHLPFLWEAFDPQTQLLPDGFPINWRFGGKEQAWISEMIPWDDERCAAMDIGRWDHRDGIYGAGRMLKDQGVRTTLPDNAKIVSFPGNRLPDQPEVQESHPWIGEFYK